MSRSRVLKKVEPATVHWRNITVFGCLTTLALVLAPERSAQPPPAQATATNDRPEPSGELSSRNENSTPRNSILPASPAIAQPITGFATPTNDWLIAQTKAVLLQLGYEPGSLDGRITARFKAALFSFQRAHDLSATGEPDAATLRELGVRSN
jgi:peptidoglycan hydrolase-like protein with peptidoglycan-binding domain